MYDVHEKDHSDLGVIFEDDRWFMRCHFEGVKVVGSIVAGALVNKRSTLPL
jgi:hypothetical protein